MHPGTDTWATFVRRTRGDMPAAAFARMVNVGRATLHRWERGETVPNDRELIRRFGRLTGTGEQTALIAAGLQDSPTGPDLTSGEPPFPDDEARQFWDSMPSLDEVQRLKVYALYLDARARQDALQRANTRRRRAVNE